MTESVSDFSSVTSDYFPDEESYIKNILEEIRDDEISSTSKFKASRKQCREKILSNDPDQRKNYAKYFEESMNSSDPDTLSKLLDWMVDDTAEMDLYKLMIENSKGSEELEFSMRGKNDIIDHFINTQSKVPDLIFLVHEWKLFPRPHKRSCLVFKFTCSGSQVFDGKLRCNLPGSVEDMNFSLNLDNFDKESLSINETQHSIKFRDMPHHRGEKKKKLTTLGQFINQNIIAEHHLPEIADIKNESCDRNLSAKDDLNTVSSSFTEENSVLDFATRVNVQGVMRFMMDDNHRVCKIQCVHLHGH